MEFKNYPKRMPLGIVIDTPVDTVIGPVDDAEYPDGIEYDVPIVKLFTKIPLLETSSEAVNSPVDGLYKYLLLLV